MLHEGARFNDQLMMIGAEHLSDDACMIELGILRFAEADGKGSHWLGAVPHHGSDNRRGIDATRKIGTERRIAAHPNVDRLVECRIKHPNSLFKGGDVGSPRGEWRREVASDGEVAGSPDRIVPGLQFPDSAEEG